MKIGITERGDAGINLRWKKTIKNTDGAILITKNITDSFKTTIQKLHKEKPIILHATCTGWGNTIIEPNVPPYQKQLANLNDLIQSGFPKKNCVLRIDPIFPTPNGIRRALDVLNNARQLNLITPKDPDSLRIRISVLDEYPHVKKRFQNAGFPAIYKDRFYAPKKMMDNLADTLAKTGYQFECCAEPFLTKDCFIHQGCISELDLHIMNQKPPANIKTNPQNRTGCMCLNIKKELLTDRHPCPHKCLYCFWKDPDQA